MNTEMHQSGAHDANQDIYNVEEVVDYYARRDTLQPGEAYLFGKYISSEADIIDIGVGGGRTTCHLCQRRGRYLGIDYSAAMIEACKKRFPSVEFRVMDASDMSGIEDQSFDVAVFSFNGIDYLPTDMMRSKCLAEIARVLKSGGLLIFSSHNARALGVLPDLRGADMFRRSWRCVRAAFRAAIMTTRALCSASFYRGYGYVMDPIHGGLHTHISTPRATISETEAAGFRHVEYAAADRPAARSTYLVPWFYYVFSKPLVFTGQS